MSNRCGVDAAALQRQAESLVPLGLVGIILVLVVPIPARLLDVALVLNLAMAVMCLLMVSSVRRTLDLSCFPTLLLVLTFLRLSLNVASTRLILTQGAEFEGILIRAFGGFVVGGSLAVGLVLFFILVCIQYQVISKGSERVAEVAARFRLDGLPHKLMAVQAQLDSHQITAAEAEERVDQVHRESDFFGHMDGASRWVKNETIASIAIFGVNLGAGLVFGWSNDSGDWARVASTFALLSVGDGLASLVPSLLISFATGLLITKSASGQSVAGETVAQVFSSTRPMAGAAGVVGSLLAVCGLSAGVAGLPLVALAGIFGWAAWKGLSVEPDQLEVTAAAAPRELGFRPLEVRLSQGVFEALQEKGGRLDAELSQVRRQIRDELGLAVPPISVTVDEGLTRLSYTLDLRGQQVGEGRLPGSREAGEPVEGRIAAFVAKKVRAYADELMGRQELEDLLSQVRRAKPALFEAVDGVDRGALLAVLRGLLAEGVGIRDAAGILEAVASAKELAKQPALLTECVRAALARQVSGHLRTAAGSLPVMVLADDLEKELEGAYVAQEDFLAISPQRLQSLLGMLTDGCEAFEKDGLRPVLLTKPTLRRHVRNLFGHWLPELAVLSRREISREVRPELRRRIGGPAEGRPALAIVGATEQI
ncbi:MAG: FHIPEP family type III secretion protein [Candidatus Wallbacteria bacterium]|nr:FHIPEP family type III secretion protein [Candidatus Wallbacteria bacterium]